MKVRYYKNEENNDFGEGNGVVNGMGFLECAVKFYFLTEVLSLTIIH